LNKLTQFGDEMQILILVTFKVLLQDGTSITISCTEPGNSETSCWSLLHIVSVKVNLLEIKLPYLEASDGILQGFDLLLELLGTKVKHLKTLSISEENKCNDT